MLARCAKCQSLAFPSRAEYWHIGETTIRFTNSAAQAERREQALMTQISKPATTAKTLPASDILWLFNRSAGQLEKWEKLY